jgi:hypothetical protein
MLSRSLLHQRHFPKYHRFGINLLLSNRVRCYSSLTPSSENKHPQTLDIKGILDSNIRTQDALAIGVLKGAVKDMHHNNEINAYKAQLRANNLLSSIEDSNAEAVDNLLKTRILTKGDLQSALTYADGQINLWQTKIDSKSWWNQLNYNQKKYQAGKIKAEVVRDLVKNKMADR